MFRYIRTHFTFALTTFKVAFVSATASRLNQDTKGSVLFRVSDGGDDDEDDDDDCYHYHYSYCCYYNYCFCYYYYYS